MVMSLHFGILNGIIRRAIRFRPSIIPCFDRVILGIRGRYGIQPAREPKFQVVFCNDDSGRHEDWLSGVAHSLKAAVSQSHRLPALQSAHIKLSIDRMKTGSHDPRLEFERKLHDTGLDLITHSLSFAV